MSAIRDEGEPDMFFVLHGPLGEDCEMVMANTVHDAVEHVMNLYPGTEVHSVYGNATNLLLDEDLMEVKAEISRHLKLMK